MRRAPLRRSSGTRWDPSVVAHIRSHQGEGCIGPLAGMPGACSGPIDTDHVRSSGALGRKSASVATNGARLCRFSHHDLKTRHGREWRPRLLTVIGRLHAECASCQREAIESTGHPLGEAVPS